MADHTMNIPRAHTTAAVRARDRTRWAYQAVAGASPSSVRPCTQLETSEWVIRDRETAEVCPWTMTSWSAGL